MKYPGFSLANLKTNLDLSNTFYATIHYIGTLIGLVCKYVRTKIHPTPTVFKNCLLLIWRVQ